MLNLKDGTLWQWDTGRKVVITLDEGHTIDKVQFYNGIGINAYPATSIETVEGEILAGIPNSLLCYAKNLVVYLMTTDEDGIKTQEQLTLKVNKRAKPEDYIFTDDEFHTYRLYDERLQYLQDNIVLPEQLEQTTDAVVKKQIDELSDDLSEELHDDVDEKFNTRLKDTEKEYVLLWENATPGASFANTYIDIGKDTISKYPEFMITFRNNMYDAGDSHYVFIKKPHQPHGYDGELVTGEPGGSETQMFGLISGDGTTVLRRRRVSIREGQTYGRIYFGDVTYYQDGTEYTSNGFIIPCKIYGVQRRVLTNIDEQVAAYLEEVLVPISQDDYDELVKNNLDDDNKYYYIIEEEEL